MTTADTALLAREFPEFDLATLPTIPEGFECTAWHNDTAPTWHEAVEAKPGDMMLVVDFDDPELREVPETPRFGLQLYPEADCSPEPFFDTDDWTEMEAAIRLVRFIRTCGLGFHPDTRGRDYVDADHTRSLTDEQADQLDADVKTICGAVADIYLFGITVWQAMGLFSANDNAA